MPAAATQKPLRLRLSGLSLVAAAYLSGQPSHMLGAWGSSGAYAFRMWRVWAALGLLKPDGNNRVTRSAEYEELDPTEKTHLNYVLGGTLAKAYAADKLGVPWLAHLSLAARAGNVIQYQGARRPDYIGYTANQGTLVIAEAKGRQQVRQSLRAALDGKVQARAVVHVNGAVPVARYGILAEAPMGFPVSLYAVEPPDVLKVDFTQLQWVRRYYEFVRQLAEECADDPRPDREPIDGRPREGRLEWASMELRVPEAVLEWLNAERDLDAWPKVKADARAEVETLGRSPHVTMLPDLLIVRTRGVA